jgi:hypothetical protein
MSKAIQAALLPLRYPGMENSPYSANFPVQSHIRAKEMPRDARTISSNAVHWIGCMQRCQGMAEAVSRRPKQSGAGREAQPDLTEGIKGGRPEGLPLKQGRIHDGIR